MLSVMVKEITNYLTKISYSENFVWQVIMDVIVTFPLA